ncbi:hypothetical protein [Streptomyces sp. URMC 129]|uniref:hypothetical protein n=1 Tax=Streptomyces sp. URMC 129 TaxID=3423407 RepID=UPI003F1CFA6A
MADEETREEAATPGGQDGDGRRGWPVITAVAVAVAVIAGGLYGASGLLGDDGGGGGDSGGDASEPLVLDGAAALTIDARGDAAVALETAGPAPLRLTGDAPAAPERAAVYGFGEVTGDQVAGLAAAFGLDGEAVEESGGSWTVTSPEPGGTALTVTGAAPGHWSYGGQVYAEITDPIDPDSSVASPEMPVDDAGGTPPSQEEALNAAEPLLADLGLADADLDATLTAASQRVVRAFPVVDGLPVHGLRTELYVGPEGEVTSATGVLAVPEAGAERDVSLDAAGAVEGYNDALAELPVPEIACAEPAPEPGGEPEPGGQSEPVAPAEPDTEYACAAPGEKPGPVDVTAEFGLALHYSEQQAVLVPSWLFRGTLAGDIPTVVSHPAVPFSYAADGGAPDAPAEPAEPAEPADPEQRSGAGSAPGDRGQEAADPAEAGWSVAPYDASDTTLTLTFWGGVCDDYAATAEESDDEVTVRLEITNPDREDYCVLVAEEMTTEVSLDEPVGDRALLDERGEPIPVR